MYVDEMKIILTIPTPQGSKPGSTDYVQVQRIMEALQTCIDLGGAVGVNNQMVAILKAAKVEKSL